MYHVSAQGIDERMINVHYYYYYDIAVKLTIKIKRDLKKSRQYRLLL